MAISPDPTVPDVIYLDENAIDDIFSYLGQGTVSEIVRRISSEQEGSAEIGFDQVLVARLGGSSIEGEETEFVRELDPIGKLAMVREALQEEEMLFDLNEMVGTTTRDQLDRGNIVEMDTSLIRTPIEDLQDVIDTMLNLHDVFGGLMDIDEEEVEEVEEVRELITGLQREGAVLRAQQDETDFDFVLTYEEENFRNPGLGFPRAGSNYTVLGQITMKFSEGESISLINFVDLASRIVDNPREARRRVVELRNQFASAASQLTGRDVDPSEFELSHPDVEMKPWAIYR